MLTKEGFDFILRLTDYFHGHWEDPEWGRRSMSQALVGLAIHTLAAGVTDENARVAVQHAAEKVVGKSAQQMVGTAAR